MVSPSRFLGSRILYCDFPTLFISFSRISTFDRLFVATFTASSGPRHATLTISSTSKNFPKTNEIPGNRPPRQRWEQPCIISNQAPSTPSRIVSHALSRDFHPSFSFRSHLVMSLFASRTTMLASESKQPAE